MRKIIRLVLPALLVCAMPSCNRTHKRVIAVVPKAQANLFWETVHAGAVAAGQDLGVEIRWNGPASEIDFGRQINIVDDFINQHVDGIALAPSHGESMAPTVEKATEAHIPVAIFDSGINTDKYLTYVSTDNYKGGVLAGDRMAAILPNGGDIAILGNVPGSVSTTERDKGFQETIKAKAPSIKVAAFQYGMADRARSLATAEDILTANPKLLAIFCSGEASVIGAVQAAKLKGVAGKLKIIGFDSSPTLIEDLKAGNIDSLVVQNPFRMSYMAVEAIVKQLQGTPPEKRIDTGATLVTAANMQEAPIQQLLNPPIAKYLK